jgi:hypothetical protein
VGVQEVDRTPLKQNESMIKSVPWAAVTYSALFINQEVHHSVQNSPPLDLTPL